MDSIISSQRRIPPRNLFRQEKTLLLSIKKAQENRTSAFNIGSHIYWLISGAQSRLEKETRVQLNRRCPPPAPDDRFRSLPMEFKKKLQSAQKSSALNLGHVGHDEAAEIRGTRTLRETLAVTNNT